MSDEEKKTLIPMPLPRAGVMPDAIDITPLPVEQDEDPQVKIRAYDLFLNSTMDLEQIAVALELPLKSIRTWARHGNWASRKQDLLDTAMKVSEQKMQELIIRERHPTMERHLRVASKVEEAIEKTVEDLTKDEKIAKPIDLKNMADALSSASGVSGKAVGVGDEGVGNDGKRKMPVVIVNLAPTLSR